MSKDLLFDIIKRVEGEGFEIRGISFDLGNKSLMSQLGLYDGQYFFKNPFDPSRDVCMFPGNRNSALSIRISKTSKSRNFPCFSALLKTEDCFEKNF